MSGRFVMNGMCVIAWLVASSTAAAAPPLGVPGTSSDRPSQDSGAALLARSVDATIVYSHRDRIRRITLADSRPVDLGPGQCARFSPDGKHFAVYDDGAVLVMGVDGTGRKELVSDAVEDGCSVEFHANGREILFFRKKQGLFAVRTDDRTVRKLPLDGAYVGEPGISADGRRLAVRWGERLYAVDLVTGAHRLYGKGCSPGVSPDGKWLMRNVGGHHRMRIESWEGDRGFELDASSCLPEQRWDNHHWSNHPNYIVAEGDGKQRFAYVFDVAANLGTRVTSERAESPDLFVRRAPPAPALAAAAPPSRAVAASATPVAARATPPVRPRQWPGDSSALVFLWEDATKLNEIHAGGRLVRACRAEPHDAARFTRHQGMELSGGGFVADEVEGPLLEALRGSGAVSLEAIVTPDPRKRGREGGRIMAFGDNFVLRDSREDLRFFLRTADAPRADQRDDSDDRAEEDRETVLGHMEGGRPTHVLISYRPGLLVLYADGREVFRTGFLRGDLRAFAPGKLTFGAPPGDKRPWSGALEAIAVYARFIDGAEATQKHALLQSRLARRPDAAPLAARGRIVATSVVPSVASIAPYRRALVVNTYELLEAPQGFQGKRVQVASWAILDGRIVDRVARLKAGDEQALRLDPITLHPQLESERLLNDAADVDLPLFHDVSIADARPDRKR